MKTVIIIPTYNEKGNVGRLIDSLEEISKTLPQKFTVDILVVDDTSPDGTAQEVKERQKKYPNVHLFLNPHKVGLGNAYLKGMAYAVKKLKPDVLMQFDADFSHDPKRIPAFLQAVDNGADLVLGSRYIKGGSIPSNWGIHRKFYSIVGNLIIRAVMSHFAIHDWTTGYRALKKEVYEAVKNELDQERFFGYTFQIGFLHKALRKGFKIREVPIHFIDRTRGESKLGPEYIKNNLLYIFKTRFLEIVSSRFFKFGIVGGTGFVLQTILFNLLGVLLKIVSPTLAAILGGQVAIVSNYLLNNVWTFQDKKITHPTKLLSKFGQFWLTSNFAVLILQGGVVKLGELTFGDHPVYLNAFYLLGILLTLIWNYTVYNRFIWKSN